VFGIDWLRNGIPIAKETSVLKDEAEAAADAMERASYVAKQHPGREPDSFRLTDASGRICGVFPIGQRADRALRTTSASTRTKPALRANDRNTLA
jgi:hypothetical protein